MGKGWERGRQGKRLGTCKNRHSQGTSMESGRDEEGWARGQMRKVEGQ
jgi:hypothetical protein